MSEVMTRLCKRCMEEKDVSHFLMRNRARRNKWCLSCRSAYYRQWKYGLSEEGYQALFDEQRGRCAVCARGVPLVVDHDHETGQIRGLLCDPCNRGLGLLGEKLKLERALDYLAKAQVTAGF